MNEKTETTGFGFTVPTDRDRLADLGQLAGGLVHELKNPIGIILLNAELLAKNISPALTAAEREREEKRLQRIIEAAGNLQEVVHSFLSFARPERPDPNAVDINNLLTTIIDSQSERFKKDDVAVSFHPDDNLHLVAADPTHLRSIFNNIISNACDALSARKDDRRLLIVTRGGKKVARIVIANNGPAFDERIAAHLFQPFSSSKEDGTGLGLAIVKRLVDLHHGTVTASSDATRGVSFTLEFPTELGPAKARTELPLPVVEVVDANVRETFVSEKLPSTTARKRKSSPSSSSPRT
jgi:signal transduction histidine kinase